MEWKMVANKQTTVITGASTGIGKATALFLDELGFKVFAGVRKEPDGEALMRVASDRLTPILLDVTDADSIAAAVSTVAQATSGKLFALINNAGLSLNGPLELVPIADMKQLLEVNVLGVLATTKAFTPLLREHRGRLINISSGHGLLAIPDKSVYAASKFALQAVSDSLRLELKPFGISVSYLVVGKVDTAVLDKIEADRAKMIAVADPGLANLYSPLLEFFDKEVKGLPGIPPSKVAKVVAQALTAKRPKPRYLVGPGAKKMKNLARLPVGLRDRLMYRAIYG
jgi:NAD(P)-dependent dehydrogenase (short-subunit alcohol dehydrogenase family)